MVFHQEEWGILCQGDLGSCPQKILQNWSIFSTFSTIFRWYILMYRSHWNGTISLIKPKIDWNCPYYMASSASGQDEPNRALWLATRAGKMEPSCPLGTTRCIPQANFPQKPYNKSCIDQVCSVKMARYWPRSFFASLWTSTLVSVHKHAKKELGQYLAILTSHLVNNPYILNISVDCLGVAMSVQPSSWWEF